MLDVVHHQDTTARERSVLASVLAYLQLAVGAGLILVVITGAFGSSEATQIYAGLAAAFVTIASKGLGLLDGSSTS